MTSKISLGKLLQENLRHRRWMVALSLLFQILGGPVLLLLFLSIEKNGVVNAYLYGAEYWDRRLRETIREFFLGAYPVVQYVIALFGALIVSVWGFHHLFSKRMTDLYHSAPISRTRQFFALYLNGVLIWAVPFLLGWGLTLILGLLRYPAGAAPEEGTAGILVLYALSLLGKTALVFFATFHFCLVAVFVSGTYFNSFVNIAILGCEAALLYGTWYLLCREGFTTFVELAVPFEHIVWLSPLISPGYLVVMGRGSELGIFSRGLVAPLVGTILMLLLNLALALFLYRKRPSENAESGVASLMLGAALRTVNALAASALGGILLVELTNSGRASSGSLAWGIFGSLLGGALVYGILDIIHQKSFRAFFSHKLPMAAVTVCGCLIFVAFCRDWFGYDRYVPSSFNVKSARFYNRDFTERLYQSGLLFDESGLVVNYAVEPMWNEISDTDVILELLESGASFTRKHADMDPRSVEDTYLTSLDIEVERKFGGSYRRRYYLSRSCLDALRVAVGSEEYLSANYPVAMGTYPDPARLNVEIFGMSYGVLSSFASTKQDGISVDASPEMDRILSAYRADFREHRTLEDLSETMIVARLSLRYLNADWREYALDSSRAYSVFSVVVPYDYTRTLSAIGEMAGIDAPVGEQLTTDRVMLTLDGLWDGAEETADILCSYYGLVGYPRMAELEEQYLTEHGTYPRHSQRVVRLGEEDLRTVLSLGLVGGSLWARGATGLQPDYVFAGCSGVWIPGEGVSTEDLYLPSGVMPREIIDRMEILKLNFDEYKEYQIEFFSGEETEP